MRDTKEFVPIIVGFLCRWCSYAGSDMAGLSRLKQPPQVRIIMIPCLGRLDLELPLKALMEGADGVLVSGCHPGDCHYQKGNLYARRRLEVFKRFLPFMGLEEERFHYTYVSASEGTRWQQVVTEFVEKINSLGPGRKSEVRER